MQYVVAVVDNYIGKRWSARQLATLVPLNVATAWAKERRNMTVGLRKRVREGVN